MLYEYCQRKSVPHKRIGKLVVARAHQMENLLSTHRNVESLRSKATAASRSKDAPERITGGTIPFAADDVPETRILDAAETHEMEPDLSPEITGALFSPSTGIIDSHSLMQAFEADILEGAETGEGGDGSVVYSTRVVRVDPHDAGFVVQLLTSSSSSSPPASDERRDDPSSGTSEPRTSKMETTRTDAVLARTLINASGLSANLIWNSLRPEEPLPLYFARGSYASYARKAGVSR